MVYAMLWVGVERMKIELCGVGCAERRLLTARNRKIVLAIFC